MTPLCTDGAHTHLKDSEKQSGDQGPPNNPLRHIFCCIVRCFGHQVSYSIQVQVQYRKLLEMLFNLRLCETTGSRPPRQAKLQPFQWHQPHQWVGDLRSSTVSAHRRRQAHVQAPPAGHGRAPATPLAPAGYGTFLHRYLLLSATFPNSMGQF